MSTLLERAMANPPFWADQVLTPWPKDAAELFGFVSDYYWCQKGAINVFNVGGTDNQQYQGKSWLEFLQQGKRMQTLNLPLHASNPGYYQSIEYKDSMSYFTLNGVDWYVNGDGNHRTCIARFHLAELGETHLYGVSLVHRHIDWEMVTLCMLMNEVVAERKLPFREVKPTQIPFRRDDEAGTHVDRMKVLLKVNPVACRQSPTRELDREQAAALLKQWQEPTSRRWFKAWGWQ